MRSDASRRAVLWGTFLFAISAMSTTQAQSFVWGGPGGNGHTYVLIAQPLTPSAARIQAAVMGGYLVAINDAEENAFVASHFPITVPGYNAWIGLSDEVTEGTFLWDSGEPVTYANWVSGEPNNDHGNEDYVEIKLNVATSWPGQWNDGAGDTTNYAIVEIPPAQVCPPQQITLQQGTATYTQPGFDPDGVHDGMVVAQSNGWAIAENSSLCVTPTDGQIAVWETATNVNAGTITFLMQHQADGDCRELIGRFRWSVTTDGRSTFADGADNNGAVSANWTVLGNPMSVSLPEPMTYSVLGDSSILTAVPGGWTCSNPSGNVPPCHGDYTVVYPVPAWIASGPGITGIRLEVLKDSSLPCCGPGHHTSSLGGGGNFELTELVVSYTPASPCVTPPPSVTASIWVGLKNSDDIGIRFDLRAEAYLNGALVASGQLDSVPGGSSGFNNANLHAMSMSATSTISLQTGDVLSVALYVRNAAVGSGKNSGTARLWYDDQQANSGVEGTGFVYYLRTGFALAATVGSGPKQKVDVAAGAKGSPFKLFGSWALTVP